MSYLLSIDPGKSTGVALFSYNDETPADLVRAWQFGGGLSGFLRWWRDHIYEYIEGPEVFLYDDNVAEHPRDRARIGDAYTGWWSSMQLVAEKFTPLQNKGFSLTLDSVEPLRIEGAMVAMGLLQDYGPAVPSWQRPNQMYWVPGKNATEKRRNQVAWVKERFPELHLTGKDVEAPDADDARSALWHGMVWLRKHHKPSAERWFGDNEPR